MIAMKASEIASVVQGVLRGDDVTVTEAAVISSSEATPGSLFLAIKGERVDGHDYVADARSHGAVLTLATREVEGPHILVADVVVALGKLAQHVRSNLLDLIVIGITGSQGKTTTKELLTAVLSAAAPTVAPQGNFNNEIGAPLSLLHCTAETKYCIVEMGARHRGDIATLAAIARPHVGVVLKVAAAHIGEFGSIETIAETKSEMISSLDESGIAILGEYDAFTPAMASLHKGRVIHFGESSTAQVRATDIELREGRPHFDLVTPEGRTTVALRQYGLHQISNALAAAAVAHALGISTDHIAASLSTAEVHARWRMEVRELDDLVIARPAQNGESVGAPTYNFCVVVDDWEMGITQVIRGDDHVNNTPRQINMLKALGATIPQYAHLSMILGDDGQKLSKRHGAVSVMQYDEDGYLPEAVLNYLARLGWSHGDDEIFSMEQFCEWFDLNHITPSAAQFNTEKLNWINAHYIKQADLVVLATDIQKRLLAKGIKTEGGPDLNGVIALYRDRANTLNELATIIEYFYSQPTLDAAAAEKHLTPEIMPVMKAMLAELASIDWTVEALHHVIEQTVVKNELKFPKVAMPLRVMVTGGGQSPSVDAVMQLLGKEETLKRMSAFCA